MDDIQLMQISYSTDHLFKVATSFILFDFGLLDDIVEKLTLLYVLHDKKKVSGSLDDLDK